MSAQLPELTVDSVTGIDVSLPVAGAGARAYAFLIDWVIRLILALAWYSVATVIYNGDLSLAPPPESDARWFAAVAAPALAIYFLYHLVLETLMRGRTPGKRMAGVSIIGRDGSAPGVGALLTRNVFRLIDSFPVGYGVGLFTCLVTRDHVRIGDLAAGTLMIYEDRNTLGARNLALSKNPLGIATSELVAELLERWSSLDSNARAHLARAFLERVTGSAPDPAATEADLHTQLVHLAKPAQRVEVS